MFSEESLRDRQQEAVSQVTTVLGIGAEEAACILRHYKWQVLLTAFVTLGSNLSAIRSVPKVCVGTLQGRKSCQRRMVG